MKIFRNLFVLTVSAFLASAVMAGDYGKKAKKDIVDTAVSAGSFNTLAQALTEAGLVETLKGDGPFTVFAPTDEAFSKIPEDPLFADLVVTPPSANNEFILEIIRRFVQQSMHNLNGSSNQQRSLSSQTRQ